MSVSDERMERALKYLAQTDQEAAELKVQSMRLEYAADLARKRIFLISEGNNAEREAKSETSVDVQKCQAAYFDSVAAHEKVKAKRTTEALLIEVWRSLNSNRRVGLI